MSACPNCGAIARPNDRFCNTCGNPVAQAAAAPPGAVPRSTWEAPGSPADVPRCQLGHEIAPGATYCQLGHPIALAGMQFAAGGSAYVPPPAVAPYGAPPPAPAPAYTGYAPPQNFPQQPGYAPQQEYAPQQPPQAPAYAAPAPAAYAPPPPVAQPPYAGYGAPVQAPAPIEPPAPAAAAGATARILRGFLVSFQMNPAGDFWPVYTGRLTVGRSNAGEALDIPLADATISSRHATLHVDNGTVQVEDTGSTNGTFVNDEHLGFNGRRELKDGDRVRFGGFTTIMKVIARP